MIYESFQLLGFLSEFNKERKTHTQLHGERPPLKGQTTAVPTCPLLAVLLVARTLLGAPKLTLSEVEVRSLRPLDPCTGQSHRAKAKKSPPRHRERLRSGAPRERGNPGRGCSLWGLLSADPIEHLGLCTIRLAGAWSVTCQGFEWNDHQGWAFGRPLGSGPPKSLVL